MEMMFWGTPPTPRIFITLLSISIAVIFFVRFLTYIVTQRQRQLPINWPVFGMGFSLVFNVHRIHDWLVNILKKTERNFMFKGAWFHGLDFLIVADPANAYHILSLNSPNYPKGKDYNEIFDVLGDGIFNANAEKWQYQRRKSQALMSTAQFRSSVARITREKVEKELLPLMSFLASHDKVVDLQDVFLRLTFDLTCLLILGADTGCLSAEFRTDPFPEAVNVMEEVILFRHAIPIFWWKLLRWLRLGQEKRLIAAVEEIDRFIGDQISRIRREKENPNSGLLSSFVHDSLPEDVKDVDTFLRDTALSLLAAGKDTTSVALTWLFFMLSENPDIEAKVLDELCGLAQTKERGEMFVFDAEELSSLVYFHAVVFETLRLFPSVPLNHKAAVEEEVLPSGHRVTAGMRIIISPHAMGRMKGVWGEDSEQFRPDRWISEKGKIRHQPSYKFLAFSTGPRSCLGKDTAITQIKVIAAAMLYHFEMMLVEGHQVHPEASLVLLIEGGLKVKIKKRRVFDSIHGVNHKL